MICLVAFGPFAAAGVLLFDYGDISVGEFVLFKAIFGIVLGAAVTPWIDGRVRRRPAAERRRAGRASGLAAAVQPARRTPTADLVSNGWASSRRILPSPTPVIAATRSEPTAAAPHTAGTSFENSPACWPRSISM